MSRRTPTDYLLISLKGMAMGAADVVPGVSGGTVAFITGIYEELITSIRSVDIKAVKILLRGRFREFWTSINGSFLLSLFAGLLLSVFTLAGVMGYLLKTWPVFIWSFFFGLIIASAFYILREIRGFDLVRIGAFFAGGVAAWLIIKLSPVTTPDEYWFIFLSGMIGICAMILPGLSGAFLLLILGKYLFIIDAVHQINIPVILVFGAGAATGLILFSRFLSWLLSNFRSIAIAILAGFMIGSLGKVWPWKEAVRTILSDSGDIIVLQEQNLLPWHYTDITGADSYLAGAIIMFLAGIFLLFIIEYAVNRRK